MLGNSDLEELTQRHVGSLPATDIVMGQFTTPDPMNIDQARIRNGIHSERARISLLTNC